MARQTLINRELSWVAFNRRVLEEAGDPTHPLLERAKFLAIYATNLDEFYMIRVSALKEQIASGVVAPGPEGMTAGEIMEHLRKELAPDVRAHSALWRDELQPLLAAAGVQVLDVEALSPAQRALADEYFQSTLFPVLTPLAFDPGRPFPHISNLSLSLAVSIEGKGGKAQFARVKVPPSLPRLLPLNTGNPDDPAGPAGPICFVWLEQVIAANMAKLFRGTKILGVWAFRVTRDADIEISADEAADLRDRVEQGVRERGFLDVVRLEVDSDMPRAIRAILTDNLSLQDTDVWRIDGPLDMSRFWELHKLNLPALKDAPLTPRIPAGMIGEQIYARIARGDVLLHHPYDSFSPVIDFVRTAASDPAVLAIKQTLYRVGANSPIVEALIEAAQNGKQVAVMVELKARFDEENNLAWSGRLEKAGAHVVFGFSGLKVHSKIALVVRREAHGIQRYVHLSTGNYNAATARVYTDVSVFTCNEDICEDATELFNFLTGYASQRGDYRRLSVAPVNLRQKLRELIEREIQHQLLHRDGHLMFKMNALVDPEMIALLYRASQTGVKIDLLVRGMCSLLPGVPDLSETITVRSIVGRFLEHSRVYWCHNHGEPQVYLSSADVMERNLDRRVEIMFPVIDPALATRIRDEELNLGLADTAKARQLLPDRAYQRVDTEPRVNSQIDMLRRTAAQTAI